MPASTVMLAAHTATCMLAIATRIPVGGPGMVAGITIESRASVVVATLK
jgi:hypothetical protein